MAANDVILGIHSNVANDGNGFTDGHAWITVTKNGKTQSYGLWPDGHPLTIDNGPGSDIRVGMENTSYPVASRYFRLTPGQVKKLEFELKRNVTWRYTNTCASWAGELVDDIIGIDIDTDDWGGFETPRELGKHILELERINPTSKTNPAMHQKSSSW